MQYSSRKFDYYKDYIVLFIVILLSLFLILSNKSRQIETVKNRSLEIRSGLQQRASVFQQYLSLRAENRTLRLQNTNLLLENSRMRETLDENIRLRKILSFREKSKYLLIPANVIQAYKTRSMNYIILDAGLNDGVKKNLAIVVPDGLVGKIFRAGPTKSMGHVLADNNSRVSAKVRRSGVKGIIRYQRNGSYVFAEVPNRSAVVQGDTLYTSGYSNIFPEGILIGRVKKAENSDKTFFMKIEVEPEVDVMNLREVMIIADEERE